MPIAPDLVGCALDDRYELLAIIGEGAFGRVYAGRDRRLTREVAVKVIKPWWAEDAQWTQRFLREARTLARLSDPGIVQVFDFGQADEGPYYVAELVQGESLAERLRRGPLAPDQAREVGERLARALAAAHSHGVVHCDIKPANVLLADEGAVKVGDFGVARVTGGTSHTLTGNVAGTPGYMAPEQARGLPATPATDVYSAGVVLYEMLAGRTPFGTGSPVELGLRHLQDPPPPLPGHVPPVLAGIVMRALAKEPAERFADGAALAQALVLAGGASRGAPAHEPSPAGAVAAAKTGDGGEDPVDGPAAATALLGPPPTVDLAGVRGSSTTALVPRSPSAPPPREGAEPVRAEGPQREAAGRGEPAGGAAAGAAAAGVAAADRPAGARAGARTAPAPTEPGSRHTAPAGRGEPRRHAPRRRRRLLTLGVVVLAAVALGAVLLASAGASTTVPDLRGLPAGGVYARAARLHVHADMIERYTGRTRGISFAQSPSPGARVPQGSSVEVYVSAGPPPVAVPYVVGLTAAAAERRLAGDGLRYSLALVPGPGASVESVLSQQPGAAAVVGRGSTVALAVSEPPRWRTLTTFSGSGDGRSEPVRIRGKRWRVVYDMAYEGTCLLLVTCLGPSAQASEAGGGSSFGGLELDEGSNHVHAFERGPGVYRVEVSAGQDGARWAMTIEDYY